MIQKTDNDSIYKKNRKKIEKKKFFYLKLYFIRYIKS